MLRLILKVTLRDVRPPVWRRLDVPADISLAKFHRVLQIAMGWQNVHLHEFRQGRHLYGTSDREFGVYRISEASTRVCDLLAAEKARLDYFYDFGDDWRHQIVVEQVVEDHEPVGANELRCAVVTAAKGACPPEDCGGTYGYANLLTALADPNHPGHAEMKEWYSEPWDATTVPVVAINRRLARLRLRPIPPRRRRPVSAVLDLITLDHTLIHSFKRRGRA
jgi:hypothetical protein